MVIISEPGNSFRVTVEENNKKGTFLACFYIFLSLISADDYKGSYPNFDDQTTTNIYLGNINPKVRKYHILNVQKSKNNDFYHLKQEFLLFLDDGSPAL